jgi:hypothetical protein
MQIYKHKTRNIYLFTYDWKDMPNWHDVNKLIRLFDTNTIKFYSIDTRSDDYGVMVTDEYLVGNMTDELYRDCFYDVETFETFIL